MRNCLAVIIAADAWGVERQVIVDALATFKSVRRRCEVRGEVNGITVIDDFAHHPTAVRETLAAFKLKYQERRIGRRVRTALAHFMSRNFSEYLHRCVCAGGLRDRLARVRRAARG